MQSVQGFVLVFQMALLALAVASKLGLAAPTGIHEATPVPPAPASSATHALL
jgi:hypothetical protein